MVKTIRIDKHLFYIHLDAFERLQEFPDYEIIKVGFEDIYKKVH